MVVLIGSCLTTPENLRKIKYTSVRVASLLYARTLTGRSPKSSSHAILTFRQAGGEAVQHSGRMGSRYGTLVLAVRPPEKAALMLTLSHRVDGERNNAYAKRFLQSSLANRDPSS